MGKKIVEKSISAVIISVMIFSLLSVAASFAPEIYASGSTTSKAENNKVVIPAKMKYGEQYSIVASGDRYDDLYKRYQDYLLKREINKAENVYDILKDDVSMFKNGETAYIVSKIIITKDGYYPQTIKFTHNNSILETEKYKYDLKKGFTAGKYTVKTEFVNCSVHVCDNLNSTQEVYFNIVPNSEAIKTSTFYVASKVKLNYNSKKGKLAKKHHIKYLNPTKKFGKLPSPSPKSGYKFIGWYSKNKGGKKITKSTKVPTKNTQTIYARYKKIR